jgi:hypothetical protein
MLQLSIDLRSIDILPRRIEEANNEARLVHDHVVLICLVLRLLWHVWVVVDGSWSDRTSWSLVVTLDIVPTLEVLSLWRDRWCHVAIDHVAKWLLLRCAREHVDS